MQEWLYHLYNIYPYEIKEGKWEYNNECYELIAVDEKQSFLGYIMILNEIQVALHLPIVSLVKAKNNQYVNVFDNVNYVLFKGCRMALDYNILLYIDAYTKGIRMLNANDIREKWIKRMNHIESDILPWLRHQEKHEELLISMYLAIGFGENALKYITYINNELVGSLCNVRCFSNDNLTYFNPVYKCIDNEMRDICSLYKNHYIDINDVLCIIKDKSIDEIIYLISRLLYPAHFFDYIEDVYLEICTNDYDYIVESKRNCMLINALISEYHLLPIKWLDNMLEY